MIRVLIRASSPLAAAGLKQLIAGEPDFAVLRADGEGPGETPDVILAEAEADDEGAWDAHAEMAEGGAALVLLADDPGRAWIAEAIGAGARAVLPRTVTRDELAAALRAAASGLVVLPKDDAFSLLAPRTGNPGAPTVQEPLTPRERVVLEAMGSGLANKEIASRLGISEHTVKFHVASILAKLGAASRTEAVMIAVRRGMLMV
jgi:DNA-binding NarL/FixJ family response regulator